MIKFKVTSANAPLFQAIASGIIQPGAITPEILCEGYLILAWARRNLLKLSTRTPPYSIRFNYGEAKAIVTILHRIHIPGELADILRNEVIYELDRKLPNWDHERYYLQGLNNVHKGATNLY